MKQTAVDWVFEQLDEQVYKVDYDNRRISISISFEDMMTLKKEAKEMEKEQTVNFANDFYDDCVTEGGSLNQSAEEYYKQTYKQ